MLELFKYWLKAIMVDEDGSQGKCSQVEAMILQYGRALEKNKMNNVYLIRYLTILKNIFAS